MEAETGRGKGQDVARPGSAVKRLAQVGSMLRATEKREAGSDTTANTVCYSLLATSYSTAIHQLFTSYSSAMHQLLISYSSAIHQLFISYPHGSLVRAHNAQPRGDVRVDGSVRADCNVLWKGRCKRALQVGIIQCTAMQMRRKRVEKRLSLTSVGEETQTWGLLAGKDWRPELHPHREARRQKRG